MPPLSYVNSQDSYFIFNGLLSDFCKNIGKSDNLLKLNLYLKLD